MLLKLLEIYMFSISWKFTLIKQLIKARVPVMESAESSGTINGLIERFHTVCARHHQPRYNQ